MEFDNRISVGNILVGGAMLVSFILAWGNISARTARTADEVANNKSAIAAQESRIRAVEQSTARQDERMVLILESLRKIEKQFEQRGYLTPPYKGADHQ
ncbi:hypothetical protein [Pontibaca methylaminivorans]|nr:hypothetical protein [Pontibaca methylaminivorans]